jgi:hypothetical protein
MTAYVYYSYEEWGRGYIGSRSKSPIGDEKYFGSFSDQTFCPTAKIILAEFDTMEQALEVEIALHNFLEIELNSHFANKARQTSKGWIYRGGGGKWSEERKRRFKGRSHSQITRNKMRESWTEELRRSHSVKIIKALTGTPKSETHKQNLSKAVKGRKYITNDLITKVHNPNDPLPAGYRWGRAKGITKRKES